MYDRLMGFGTCRRACRRDYNMAMSPTRQLNVLPRPLHLLAAQGSVIEAGDKTIIVESDGTIIIGSPEAVARAQANSDNEEAAPESAETDYLAGA
jgi:hypothetical protein